MKNVEASGSLLVAWSDRHATSLPVNRSSSRRTKLVFIVRACEENERVYDPHGCTRFRRVVDFGGEWRSALCGQLFSHARLRRLQECWQKSDGRASMKAG